MMEWKTIETAPKDGTKVLLAIPGYKHPQIGYWVDSEERRYGILVRHAQHWTWDGNLFVGILGDKKREPSHWMPLPSLPAQYVEQELTELSIAKAMQ